MAEFIYAKKQGVHIFDLEKTAEKLSQAMMVARDLTAEGKQVVLVGTKRQAKAIIREEAEKCQAPFVAERWLGGTITNWEQIKKSLDRLKDLREKKEAGELKKKYTKKENLLIDREIDRLDRFFGGLVQLNKIPEAIFVVDVKKEIAAVREAKQKGVKVIAMVDSNGDPDLVDHAIPANDDAVRSIKLVVSKIAEAIGEGRALQGKGVKSKK